MLQVTSYLFQSLTSLTDTINLFDLNSNKDNISFILASEKT
jgi:hypothetical protein